MNGAAFYYGKFSTESGRMASQGGGCRKYGVYYTGSTRSLAASSLSQMRTETLRSIGETVAACLSLPYHKRSIYKVTILAQRQKHSPQQRDNELIFCPLRPHEESHLTFFDRPFLTVPISASHGERCSR